MKQTALRLMTLAAAAVAAVTTASAQNMKAEIPFPFQAVGARMQPGTYWVTFKTSGASPVVQIYNEDNRKSILALPQVASTPARPQYGAPVLTFACTDGRCVLSSLRNDQAAVYSFHSGKTGPGTQIATIALKADRAE